MVKTFGGLPVLRGVSLDVGAGECLALLGPNGAGKSTLLRILATLLRPTRGAVSILGRSLPRDADLVRGQVGLVGHDSHLYEDLTALENLRFWNTMGGRRTDPAALRDALGAVELCDVADERVRTFSAGMKRRLSLARYVGGDARVLLLDEPFSALDQRGKKWLEAHLQAFTSAGGTVVMATHSFGRSLGVADRIVILSDGTIALDRPASGLSGADVERLYAAHTEEDE